MLEQGFEDGDIGVPVGVSVEQGFEGGYIVVSVLVERGSEEQRVTKPADSWPPCRLEPVYPWEERLPLAGSDTPLLRTSGQ